jgi:hypothetical protein
MQLAYFCNRNQPGDIHSKFLLIDELKKLGIETDFYTAAGGRLNFSQEWVKKSGWDINWLTKSSQDLQKEYDGVIVSTLRAKDGSTRDSIISNFKNSGKKVIQIYDSMCFDPDVNMSADAFIFPSNFFAANFIPKNRLVDSHCAGIFISPHFRHPKILSKEEFCSTYGINPDHKIIAIFPSRSDRIRDFNLVGHDSFDLYTRLTSINKVMKAVGYELVLKLHRYEYYGWKVDSGRLRKFGYPAEMTDKDLLPHQYYLPDLKCIDDKHFSELINYSESSVIFNSSLSFFHHIFRRPNFYAGNLWTNDRAITLPPDVRNKPEDLVFGEKLNPNNYSDVELASHIIQRTCEYNFDNFMYKDDHPLTGQAILNPIAHAANIIKGILA